MPWFRKTKRKHKISKKDISEPSDFKHCYHTAVGLDNQELEGLPPQWSQIVGAPARKKQLSDDSIKMHSPYSTQGDIKKMDVKERGIFSPLTEFSSSTPGNMTSTGEVSTGNGVSLKDYIADNLIFSSKNSLVSTNSSQSLTKRPSPVVRGSDTSLEDTIKCIRKQSQHRSNKNFEEEEHSNRRMMERDGIHRNRFYTRSRTGSFMQLRSSPINRKHVASYTSGTVSVTPHTNDRTLPTSFCLSAPSEVVQSDLGLYNGAETESSLSQCRVNSPIGSSGYFGSSGSSLYSSRVSSMQQVPTATYSSQRSQPQARLHNTPALPLNYKDSESRDGSNSNKYPHLFSSHQHHQQHRYCSVQNSRVNFSNSGSRLGHHTYSYRPSATGNGARNVQSGGAGHYGTAPRVHRSHFNSQYGGQYPNVEMDRIQELGRRQLIEEQQGLHLHTQPPHTQPPHPPSSNIDSDMNNSTTWSSNESAGWSAPRKEMKHRHRNSKGNFDQFRAALELLVNPGDPQGKYVDFVKIGEGSTGLVYTARDVSTGKVVAVKKMNLRKQQRKELLFNEVINIYA